MPKSNLLRTETARKNYASRARAGIKRYIELSKVPEDKIAAKQNVQVRTLMNRMRIRDQWRLRDLWDLAEIINAPVGELAEETCRRRCWRSCYSRNYCKPKFVPCMWCRCKERY